METSIVRLVAHTTGYGPLEGRTPEEIITYCARVSSPKNQENFDTAARILRYCIKQGHWSIFESCSLTFEITCPMAIATQILRHRSGTFQQFSGRYAQMTTYTPVEARRQDMKNRQNSIDDMSEEDRAWFLESQEKLWAEAKGSYDEAIERGIAKESARFLLPMNTTTTLYFTNNVRNFIHYVDLRTANGTQREHMEVAEKIKAEMIRLMPNVAKALGWTTEDKKE